MAYSNPNTKRVPLGAVTTLRIVDSVLYMTDRVVAWNQARMTRKILLGLSAEQLEDIGLTQADLR
jgi:uncharacterized protein YjiS (DUF1127 family)